MIRPATAADVEPLARRLAGLPLHERYGRDAAALARAFEAALTRGDWLLVHDDGGLAWFLPGGTFGVAAYLRLLAVAPGQEGRGIGAELLAAFEAASAPTSRHASLLVSDFNHPAQRFYERHGYRQVGALPGLVLPDVSELIYWKTLTMPAPSP